MLFTEIPIIIKRCDTHPADCQFVVHAFIFTFFPTTLFQSLSEVDRNSWMMSGVAPLCGFCKEVPTHHCCMPSVHKGGIHMDGVGGFVCSQLICAPWSSSFRNEDGIFCCLEHSDGDAPDDDCMDNNHGGTSGESLLGPRKKSSIKGNKGIRVYLKRSSYPISSFHSHLRKFSWRCCMEEYQVLGWGCRVL